MSIPKITFSFYLSVFNSKKIARPFIYLNSKLCYVLFIKKSLLTIYSSKSWTDTNHGIFLCFKLGFFFSISKKKKAGIFFFNNLIVRDENLNFKHFC